METSSNRAFMLHPVSAACGSPSIGVVNWEKVPVPLVESMISKEADLLWRSVDAPLRTEQSKRGNSAVRLQTRVVVLFVAAAVSICRINSMLMRMNGSMRRSHTLPQLPLPLPPLQLQSLNSILQPFLFLNQPSQLSRLCGISLSTAKGVALTATCR